MTFDGVAWGWRFFLVASLTACGPSGGDDGDDGNSDAEDATTQSTATGGDGNDSMTGPGDGSGDGSGDGDISDSGSADEGSDDGLRCEAFEAEEGTMVTMGVQNMTGQPVFLATNGCNDPIGVTGPDGPEVPSIYFPDCIFPACHNTIAGECSVACAGGAGACQEVVVRVDPGATHVRTWTGGVWIDAAVPAACTTADCETACHQLIAAAAGTYGLTVQYGPCPNSESADCECPNGEATCSVLLTDGFVNMFATGAAEFVYPDEAMPTIIIR